MREGTGSKYVLNYTETELVYWVNFFESKHQVYSKLLLNVMMILLKINTWAIKGGIQLVEFTEFSPLCIKISNLKLRNPY